MPDMLAPPIDDSLICSTADGIALIASRDRRTGRVVFPARPQDDVDHERITLSGEGRLWSWTIQRFRPKSPPYAGPEAFEPYAVGYVELDDQLIVEGRLVDVAFDGLAIGAPMRLVPYPFTFADGSVRASFAFAPMTETSA